MSHSTERGQFEHGKFEGDAYFDSFYAAARRQHEEALRRAEMARQARSVTRLTKHSHDTKSRFALHMSPAGALETIVLIIGRWGRQAAPGRYG